jgi:hypothetical protein
MFRRTVKSPQVATAVRLNRTRYLTKSDRPWIGGRFTTRRRDSAGGADAAVLAPVKEWRSLKPSAKPTLKALLLADAARGELNVPERGDRRRRAPPKLVRR